MTTSQYAPISMPITWYLPRDGDKIRITIGYVSGYQVEVASADFTPAIIAAQAEENDEPVPVTTLDPVALATTQLSANVEKLRTTVKWVGGLLVVALLMLVFK